MTRLFVDVGSHYGQTLVEVAKPHWKFDQIHAIEPMPRQFEVIHHLFRSDERFRLYSMALASETKPIVMYGTNDLLEASVYPGKDDVDAEQVTIVNALDATEFFSELPDAEIWVNMNCEGAEVPILDSLLFSGEIKRIKHLLVDFDIRKVPGEEHHADRLRSALNTAGISYSETQQFVSFVSHQEQIAAWLRRTLA